MKAYVTKHCLTEGIVEVEAEVSPRSPNTIRVGEGFSTQHFHTPDWHADRETAVMAAMAMRRVAVKKLSDELERLSHLEF